MCGAAKSWCRRCFATPVTTVDTLRTNLDTRIVISAEGKYEQLAYQSDNEFTIEINPAADEAEEAPAPEGEGASEAEDEQA